MPDSISLRTHYMKHVYDDRRAILKRAGKHLAGVEFDTLVGTGLSGALIVPTLANAFGCHSAIVRKDGDGSHSCRKVEGVIGRRWVFVDDLIDSGKTYRRVVKAVAEEVEAFNKWSGVEPFVCEHVGSYLYQNYGKPLFEAPREEPKPIDLPLDLSPIIANAPPVNAAYRSFNEQCSIFIGSDKKPAFALDPSIPGQ